MLKNTKKYIGIVASIRVENILRFQIKGCWEAWQEGHWGCWKGPKIITFFEARRGTEKNIMCAENINVLVGEN